MPRKLVGVRFQRAGRVYYCDPGDLELQVNDWVVVEMEGAPGLAWVVMTPRQLLHVELMEPPKPVLRLATNEDLAR